ncbi:MAG: NTP transferase domain-containing protein, partial [Nitrososphaerales archaeon]
MAIIMAGGRGRRMLSGEEKPMLRVRGKPMVGYVLEALRNSGCFERIIALVSSNTPRTANFLAKEGVTVSNSSGRNYVKDLNDILLLASPKKVLITPSDLPLLDSNAVRSIAGRFERCSKPCLSVVVSKAMVERMGVSSEYCFEHDGKMVCNTGVSVIDSSQVSGYDALGDETLIMDEPQLV